MLENQHVDRELQEIMSNVRGMRAGGALESFRTLFAHAHVKQAAFALLMPLLQQFTVHVRPCRTLMRLLWQENPFGTSSVDGAWPACCGPAMWGAVSPPRIRVLGSTALKQRLDLQGYATTTVPDGWAWA